MREDLWLKAAVEKCKIVGMTATETRTAVGVAEKIRQASRSDLARELGMSRTHVSQVLNGKGTPSLETAAVLAKRIGVSLDALHEYWEGARELALVN